MELKLRDYENGDYEKYISPLDKENMEKYIDKHIEEGWSDEINKENFQKYLEKGWIHIFEINNKPIGHLIITPDEEEKNALFINGIQIKKEFQGKGYGTKILKFVEEKAKQLKLKKIKLYVFEDNPAFNLYQRFGYNQIDFLIKSNTKIMEKILN